ncbi:MAG TPA: hypothetical protein PKM72_03260 [Nitrospirales bacterium]|nr:hypothetical protein [Nitrospirales bacterium]
MPRIVVSLPLPIETFSLRAMHYQSTQFSERNNYSVLCGVLVNGFCEQWTHEKTLNDGMTVTSV